MFSDPLFHYTFDASNRFRLQFQIVVVEGAVVRRSFEWLRRAKSSAVKQFERRRGEEMIDQSQARVRGPPEIRVVIIANSGAQVQLSRDGELVLCVQSGKLNLSNLAGADVTRLKMESCDKMRQTIFFFVFRLSFVI